MLVVTGEWFTVVKNDVHEKDIIAVLKDRSLTSCQLACETHTQCERVGMRDMMERGQCFLIGGSRTSFSSGEDILELFVTKRVS